MVSRISEFAIGHFLYVGQSLKALYSQNGLGVGMGEFTDGYFLRNDPRSAASFYGQHIRGRHDLDRFG